MKTEKEIRERLKRSKRINKIHEGVFTNGVIAALKWVLEK